jgi:hypothetical protein
VTTTDKAGPVTLNYTPTAGVGAVGTKWACTSASATKWIPAECRP